MNKLKEAIDKIEDKEAESRVLPEEADPRTRTGVEALVRNAKKDLDKLYREYKDLVMNQVVVIGVKGKTAQQFAEQAEKLGSISVDFDLIVNRLVRDVKKHKIGDRYSSNAHMMLIHELSKVRTEYDMVKLAPPVISGYSDGIYDAPIEDAVRKLIEKNYGSTLQSVITRKEVGNKALKARFLGKKLPVIVYNLDKEIDSTYLNSAYTVIESDGEATSAGVKKKLQSIASAINAKHKSETEESPKEVSSEQ